MWHWNTFGNMILRQVWVFSSFYQFHQIVSVFFVFLGLKRLALAINSYCSSHNYISDYLRHCILLLAWNTIAELLRRWCLVFNKLPLITGNQGNWKVVGKSKYIKLVALCVVDFFHTSCTERNGTDFRHFGCVKTQWRKHKWGKKTWSFFSNF